MRRTDFRDNFKIKHEQEIKDMGQMVIDSGADYFQNRTGKVFVDLEQACTIILKHEKENL